CWALKPDVAIQLFPYPKATNFILSYSRTKTKTETSLKKKNAFSACHASRDRRLVSLSELGI
ncbi:hypothetical protein ABEW03_11050, partial [Virgibacillus pantothenticus]|uniref:hypothetical protein n=1 Tax=Virgibacillus pantothenticus TaxID=1473 RepID=UPI003D291506